MEFAINEFLSLKLEGDFTVIYVAEKPFQQCKFLLLEIPVRDITSLDKVKSIDEAARELSRALEPSDEFPRVDQIPPETEFWGHCSNLQAWYENDYNTRLLHSNLAFPLLKKLTEAGDLLARKVFKDEIAKRYNSGIENVRKFLEKGDYLRFLTKEEFYSLIDTGNEYETLKVLEGMLDVKRYQVDIRNGRVIKLSIGGRKLKELPEIITQFKHLEILNVAGNSLDAFPDWIGRFKDLKLFRFNNNHSDKLVTLPDMFGNLSSLEELVGFNNELRRLPDSFGRLISLKRVDLHNNKLEGLPDSIGGLINLEELNLKSNSIKLLPESIGNLKSLKTLALAKNSVSVIPKTIERINSLEILTFDDNKLKEVPDSIGNLKDLEILSLTNNSIKTLPYSFKNLVSLRTLTLDGNPIGEIPEFIFDLPNLILLFVKDTKIRKSLNLKKKLKEKILESHIRSK